jgi:catechol 2,3-dioxygenase-like lactoylglutathione lyase family enzyme
MVKKISTILCQVSDMDRAVAFYRDQLEMTPGMTTQWWSTFPLGDVQIGLHPPFERGPSQDTERARPVIPIPRGWILGIEVDDLAALRAKLEGIGTACADYHDTPAGCVMDFADPDGNPIQAMQLGAKAASLR